MADDSTPAPEAKLPATLRGGKALLAARILGRFGVAILVLAALVFAGLRWLDTDDGRAFLIRQLPSISPESGLKIRAERIEGSIYGKAIIHGLTLADPQGVFARVPKLAIDWRPLDLLENRLTLRSLTAAEVQLLRLPKLRPTKQDRLLPDIDIDIGTLRIDRLVLEAPVSGKRRVLGLAGSADIRSGRAKIDLLAQTLPGTQGAEAIDVLHLKLDAEPDRDKFDLDAMLSGPADGVVAGVLGLKAPLDARLVGDGSWKRWKGQLQAKLGGAPLANVALTGTDGLFEIAGDAQPALLLKGVAAQVLGPRLAITASARLAKRHADVTLRAASAALVVSARGGLDFADEAIEALTVSAELRDPSKLNARLAGRDVRLNAKLAGSFVDPLIDYKLTAASLTWGPAIFSDLRAAGIVRGGERPLVVPVRATASRITGVGDVAEPLLTNVQIDGPLTFAAGQLKSSALALRTDRLTGKAMLAIPFNGTPWRIDVIGALPRYAIDGLGLVDVNADLVVRPAGRGAQVTGSTRIDVTRLDNGFFTALTRGLPRITADIVVAPDLSLAFTNARLASPGLALAASGSRSPQGLVQLTGSGSSSDYGPLTLRLAGPITAPVVDAVLLRPGFGIGLATLAVHVEPAADGWSFQANGASDYGPATGRGLINTRGEAVRIDLEAATLAGVTARGSLLQAPSGPFTGRFALSGSGLSGSAVLAAAGDVQRADITMTAKDATLATAVPVTIGQGRLRLAVLLPAAGPSATGSIELTDIERDGIHVDRADAVLSYAQGRGTMKASASGTTDIPFSINADAAITPERIEVRGGGRLGRNTVSLSGPAVFTYGAQGWSLAPVSLVTADGKAEFSGLIGQRNRLRARFDKVSLSLISAVMPRLDFSGRISGTLDLSLPTGGVPTGIANLRVNGLSRAGIASASLPIDLGLNARLTAAGAVARAVIVQGGKVEGRLQAQLGPIPAGSASLTERLFASQVKAQVRFNGPAQAIWGLSGIEALDVRGPVSLVADINGVLGDPRITGTLRSAGARVESTLLGAVIEDVALDSRFTGSRLELTRFSGKVGSGGTIRGTGGIDLSYERAFPMDIRLLVKNAQLLNRDDFSGTGSGRIRIATDEYGGVVSGKLVVDRATFRIGKAAVAEVPVLLVTERNTRTLGRPSIVYLPPTRWLLNLEVTGERRLFVSGMGIESEWSADLKVKGGATTPELIGRVTLVRGDYDFAGKRFALTKGDLRFAGGYPPDPLIDITAESTTSGFTAQLAISGTAGRPNIRFSSVPALPEDEVLSRVLFGASVTNLSAPEAVQLAGALASLRGGGGGFNPINSVRKGLGIDRLRILPSDSATGRGTAVAAGQYIGRNVYVELATDAQGYTATNIEVSLTRSLSILSEVATLGGTSANLRWKKDY